MRYAAASVLCLGVCILQVRTPATLTQPTGGTPAAQRERAYRGNNVGVAHLEQFDYPGAEAAFREALKLHPGLALARLNLAIALFYGGRAADAATEAGAAAKALPDVPQTHYVLGLAARGEDNLDEAVAAFERVLKIDPEDAGAKIQLGQIRLQQRRYDDALRLFQEAVAAEPYNVTAAYSVALALTRSGKPEEGRAAMQRFETLRDSPYGFTYAQTYLAQGKHAEAIASTGAEPELVSQATPDVTFSDASAAMLPAAGSRTAAGAITLFDADSDGDLDLFVAGGPAQRLLRNQDGVLTDDSGRARVGTAASRGPSRAVAGDFDNDGRMDLFVAGAGAFQLLQQMPDTTFQDVTSKAGFPSPPDKGSLGAISAADVDHDGDLDLLIAATPAQLLRNNGNGTFAEIAAAAGLQGIGPATALAATDFDNRRDIDFLVLSPTGPVLYRNMRDGTFRDVSSEAGLQERGAHESALATGDVNKDGYVDFFFSRPDSGVLALSDGRLRFRATPAPEGSRGAHSARFIDYDNDGLLDLVTADPRRIRLFRNAGGTWSETTGHARLDAIQSAEGAFEGLAAGDLDGDGDTDLVLQTAAGPRVLRNDGGNRNASLRARLVARVSNRAGVGAKVEMRAGSLRQILETASSSPAVTPADLVFGLGSRTSADVLRVLWPSGILQAETELQPSAAGASSSGGTASVSKGSSGRRPPITITELDRKPSSCPYLFTWNGTRFEFVTDVMGGGEMGAWLQPSVWNSPDPDEYVRIRGDQLVATDGRYELRLTNELEEALFYDRVQLLAVDHPIGVELFPNEGLRSPPRPPFALTPVRGARPPARAVDHHGHDVLSELAALDRRYADDFALLPIRGYAEGHELIVDVGPVSGAPVLLLTGWTDYAFSNDNVAASQGRVAMQPPALQVKDMQGHWRTVIDEIGFPVGRPQTVAVDLAGKFLSSSREVRIVTNMRIYWDQVLVGERSALSSTAVARIDPATADLTWRGFSEEITPDGREPYGYDYQRVSKQSPWKVMAGRYTREGDVRELLRGLDDLFVISQPGDELALSFDAPPSPGRGRQRTFLLYVHGYSKEMNPRSAAPDTVAPLPFRAMSGYPYGPEERYPTSPRHRDYQERYNTRTVFRSIPSIDRVVRGDER